MNKTLELVQVFYYWPKMHKDIRRDVEKCTICQKAKGTSSNVGLYHPFSIPNRSWKCISMDFIIGSPKTRNRFDNIYVVVDMFSKMSHFIPCKAAHDASYTALVFQRIF